MQGRKNYTEKLFTSFQLSDRVPKDNFYRKLRESLDLNSIYKDTRELYGNTGNPSIDPVVWYDIDNKYLQGLKTFVQSHESLVPAFMPWNGTDDEGNYNLKAAKRLGGQCWDKSLYRTTEYKHGIEFCDILFENHVIHVKKYESSALNSHLLMQTAVSAQLLSTDMNLKKWIKQKREEKFSDKHLIDDNLALINEEVIYVILLLSKRKGRLFDILPFFSLISFNIVIKRIVQLGYVVKIAKT